MYVAIAKLDELSDAEGKRFEIGGHSVALFKDGDVVHAIENRCPHEGAPLSEGFYDCGVVICPLHAWEFNIVTGRSRNGPERVRVFPVRILADGGIEVDLPDSGNAVDLP